MSAPWSDTGMTLLEKLRSALEFTAHSWDTPTSPFQLLCPSAFSPQTGKLTQISAGNAHCEAGWVWSLLVPREQSS